MHAKEYKVEVGCLSPPQTTLYYMYFSLIKFIPLVKLCLWKPDCRVVRETGSGSLRPKQPSASRAVVL